ncbi:MAG TPA: hypothetical protein VLX28_24275, partial [Thermoanaerobaculia bacterium]|nr:hypothetical protein [Thermoanaerobaculia bacterium]
AAKSESDVIEALSKILGTCRDGNVNAGACVFTAGTKVYCVVLTQAECTRIAGDWHAGKTCHQP